ncbi:MAG: helix-turn-helix domain-containing protein [Patescibacteria group bacterium]|nr:MAG: helix-turn-helix domain-containing protein [Patescibacteria group bacterium]
MDKNLINSLVYCGFTKNESAIYIYLLKKIEATVFDISKETSIPRATVYLTLDKLKKQKIVSLFRKNNVQYYTPENPLRLKAIIEEKDKAIKNILPELNAIIDTDSERPDVRLYTGVDGVKIVLEDILDTMVRKRQNMLLAASRTEIIDRFPKYFPDWIDRREKLKIKSRLILPESERKKHIFEQNEWREVRYLPDTFGFKAMIEIYANKIAVFNLKEGEIYSIVIESESIVQTFIQFFMFSWENSQP